MMMVMTTVVMPQKERQQERKQLGSRRSPQHRSHQRPHLLRRRIRTTLLPIARSRRHLSIKSCDKMPKTSLLDSYTSLACCGSQASNITKAGPNILNQRTQTDAHTSTNSQASCGSNVTGISQIKPASRLQITSKRNYIGPYFGDGAFCAIGAITRMPWLPQKPFRPLLPPWWRGRQRPWQARCPRRPKKLVRRRPEAHLPSPQRGQSSPPLPQISLRISRLPIHSPRERRVSRRQ